MKAIVAFTETVVPVMLLNHRFLDFKNGFNFGLSGFAELFEEVFHDRNGDSPAFGMSCGGVVVVIEQGLQCFEHIRV